MQEPDLKAVVYCQDCEHYLCQACLDVHNTWWEGMKPHSVATIEDLMSGKVTLVDTKHKYCTDHEEEQNKFYCKTCNKLVCRDCILMIQHCRDHEYITLKDAAKEKLSVIEKKIKTCDKRKKECQDALKNIQTVMAGLDEAAADAKAINEIVEGSYLQQINEYFARRNSAISGFQDTRKKTLDSAEKGLQDQLKQLHRAEDRWQSLTKSASPHDTVANYDDLEDTLENLSKIKLTEVDDSLVDIPVMSIPAIFEFSASWIVVGQFNVPCENSKLGPRGIDVTSDGKLAVCQYLQRVMVLSRSGNLIHTIGDSLWFGGGDGDVSITSANACVTPQLSKGCKVVDSNNKLLSEFETYNAKKESSEAIGVSVDKNDCIILGMADNAISVHNAGGSLKSSFAIPAKPRSVAVTSREEIAVAGDNNALKLYNYSGKCLRTLDPPPEVKTWLPWYVCCSKKDELFVVNGGNPEAIYKYAAGRVYMGCVTTEVNDPWGIALSHDDQELYVTEQSEKLVKIFRKP